MSMLDNTDILNLLNVEVEYLIMDIWIRITWLVEIYCLLKFTVWFIEGRLC